MVFLLPSPTPPPGLAKDHKKYVFFFRTPSLRLNLLKLQMFSSVILLMYVYYIIVMICCFQLSKMPGFCISSWVTYQTELTQNICIIVVGELLRFKVDIKIRISWLSTSAVAVYAKTFASTIA